MIPLNAWKRVSCGLRVHVVPARDDWVHVTSGVQPSGCGVDEAPLEGGRVVVLHSLVWKPGELAVKED